MTARDAVELVGLIKPEWAIPIHYEGWTHFKQGREATERELATRRQASAKIRWVPIGEPVSPRRRKPVAWRVS